MTSLANLGFLIVLIGIILIIAGSFTSQEKTESNFFIGGFFGFIPFGFANNKKMLFFGIILTIVLIIALSQIK